MDTRTFWFPTRPWGEARRAGRSIAAVKVKRHLELRGGSVVEVTEQAYPLRIVASSRIIVEGASWWVRCARLGSSKRWVLFVERRKKRSLLPGYWFEEKPALAAQRAYARAAAIAGA